MLNLIIFWVLSAFVLFIVANLLPGVAINNFGTALAASFILGLINMLIKPVLVLLTLPVNLLTFGLFSFVINAALFALTAYLIPGFEVSNFGTALLGSLLLSMLGGFVLQVVPKQTHKLS
jgi:putative membrane protein